MRRLTIKEIAIKLNVSESTAGRISRDIKQELEIPFVTMQHIKEYLKIPHAQNM